MDTPGLGDDDQKDFAEMMMDYLPNALVFVFVINVAAAGGLQKDRVSNFYILLGKNTSHYQNMNNLLDDYAYVGMICGYSAVEHNIRDETWYMLYCIT